MITVNDMYKDARSRNAPLLSDYNAPFWSEYLSDFSNYDRVFTRLYKSFEYFLQEEDDTVPVCRSNFTEDVKCHLIANSKKYAELYRTFKIDDSSYSLTDNYDVTEIFEKRVLNDTSNTFGARTDTTDTEVINGEKNSSTNTIYGSKTNTDNVNHTEQLREKEEINNLAKTTTNSINSVAPMDSETFFNNTKDVSETNAKVDTKTIKDKATVEGQNSYIDSDNRTVIEGEHSDSINITEEAVTNSTTDNFTKGEQNDYINSELNEESTLHKKGNIGIQTATDMIDKHNKFWKSYEFYTLIFRDICRELLSI